MSLFFFVDSLKRMQYLNDMKSSKTPLALDLAQLPYIVCRVLGFSSVYMWYGLHFCTKEQYYAARRDYTDMMDYIVFRMENQCYEDILF